MDEEKVKILKLLEANKAFLAVHDKTSPEEINRLFGMSKGAFKKAIGALYKQKIITIKEDGIYLQK
jgi:predicted RNA-binding protein (virulence factor B family)